MASTTRSNESSKDNKTDNDTDNDTDNREDSQTDIQLETVSARLVKHSDKIVRLWEQGLCKGDPAIDPKDCSIIRESIPEFLEQLALALGSLGGSSQTNESGPHMNSQARVHQSKSEASSLQKIILEYRILRSAIIDVILDSGSLSSEEARFIHDAIDQAVSDAADAFLQFKILNEQDSKLRALEDAKRLKLEQELREQFVSTLTHDLRTPLTAVKTSAQLIGRRLDSPEFLAKLAMKIGEDVDRVQKMIQDLLDSNLIRAGKKLPLDLSYCDLRTIATHVIDDATIQFGNRFILNTLGCTRGYWSQEGLRRVLENLLTNAVKYGCPDSPITVEIKQRGTEEILSVHNEGEHIAIEEQAHLFEPFRRLKSAQKQGNYGWGIGLTLVRGVVEAHGGSIKIQSEPGEGTAFIIVLPKDSRALQQSA